MSAKSDFQKAVQKYGSDYQNIQTVRLGKLDGVTVRSDVDGILWARQWNGREIQVINRALVPSDFDLRVLVGTYRTQPNKWFILQIMEDYLTPAAGGRIAYHHEQHEFGGADELTVDRKQINYYSIRATRPSSFSVIVYGGYFPSVDAFGYTPPSTTLDLSLYVAGSGAKYVSVEVDDDGVLSINDTGANFSDPDLGNISYVPVPAPGKHHVGFVLLYAGQTSILDDHIAVPMPLAVIAKGTGLQIDEAPAGSPAGSDKFPFWSVVSSALRSITFDSLKALLGALLVTSSVSNPPTDAELTSLLGNAVAKGAGYMALVQDTGAWAPLYFVISDGIQWCYQALTSTQTGTGTEIIQIDTRHLGTDDYSGGMVVGEINAASGQELIFNAGNGLAGATGHVLAYDALGSLLWTFDAASHSFPMLLALGDVDGDGDNEIAVTYQTPDAAVYLVDKDGAELWHYSLVGGGYGRGVAIGKVHPGYPHNQVVAGGYNGQLVLLDEDGNEIWRDTLGTYTVQQVVIADTDGDGQNEIVIPFDKYVRKYDYTGTQVWSTTLGNVHNDVLSVAVGDVTSDTGLEIAACAHPRYGSGTSRSCWLLDKDGNTLWGWTPPGGSSVGCNSVIIADVDGDGQNEIVVGYDNDDDAGNYGTYSGGIAILDSSGSLITSISVPRSVGLLAWGDVNADGVDELLMSSEGTIYIYRILTDTVQQVGRLTAYEDTKANAEALAGDLSEIVFAHATDTDELGFYIGDAWYWIGQTPDHNSLSGLQGGTTDEYYHLTQAQHDTLTDGSNADGLHTHTGGGQYRALAWEDDGAGGWTFLTLGGAPVLLLTNLE